MVPAPSNNRQASSAGRPPHKPVAILAAAVINCPATIGGFRPMRSESLENGTFNINLDTADVLKIKPTPEGPSPISAANIGSTGITHPKPQLFTN
eukprot:m.104095 g.104095  ORF g.104095 m.104095 type:complete len:95 (+) comp27551_c0_seq1:1003-1287(+)